MSSAALASFGRSRAWGGICVGILAIALGACGSEGAAPGPAVTESGISATADGAGCVTFDVDQITVAELTADADAGFAQSEEALDGDATGEAADTVAQMAGRGGEQFAKYEDRISDGAVRGFTRDLCESEAYDRDLDWLRDSGVSAVGVADTASLYDGMRRHPGLVITTLGVGACTTVEMFGGKLDAQTLTESDSPLQSEVARLALRYLCPA